MDVTELNNAFRAIESMLTEAVTAQKVDIEKRNALATAAEALDRELSQKLTDACLPEAMDQYQRGMITLNELGQQFLLAYKK